MTDFYSGKNVLVTGGTGFIGSHLVESLISRGANVRVVGRRDETTNLSEVIKKIEYLKTDLSEPRLGLAVSKRVGNAVIRNKVKRKIREAFRVVKGFFPTGYDLVIYPRNDILEKKFADYLRSFEILIARIEKKERK